jgi:hypothetical protein
VGWTLARKHDLKIKQKISIGFWLQCTALIHGEAWFGLWLLTQHVTCWNGKFNIWREKQGRMNSQADTYTKQQKKSLEDE